MGLHRRRVVPSFLAAVALAAPAAAGEFGRFVDGLAAPFRALHRSRPET